MSDSVKVLKQRIAELEKENLSLKNKNEGLIMDNDQLQERILDLEACR